MKRIVILSTILIFGLLAVGAPLFAGSEDDAKVLWTKRYNQALRDLRFGSPFEKIAAARLMGAHYKTAYVRPLGKELLKDMEQQKFLKMSTNDPYVKAHIAWALGKLEHKLAVPYLLRALDISLELAKKDNEAVEALHKRKVAEDAALMKLEIDAENKMRQARGIPPRDPNKDPYKVQVVTMGYDRPGPILNPGHAYPNSPDMYWSISDEFKGQSYNYKFEDQRVRMVGAANWLNLSRAIFAALANIADESALEGVKKYLKHPYPGVRSYAAQALGGIGRNVASAALALKEAYAAEKDERVKIYIAYAILENDKSSFEHYSDLLKYLNSANDRQRYDAIRVLGYLAMGESEAPLREALRVESRPFLRRMLEEAIYRSQIDNVMPVNY